MNNWHAYLAIGALFGLAYLFDLATGKVALRAPNAAKIKDRAKVALTHAWVVLLLVVGWPFAAINATADNWRKRD